MKRLSLALALVVALGSAAGAQPSRSGQRGAPPRTFERVGAKLRRDARDLGEALRAAGQAISWSLTGPRLQLATVPVGPALQRPKATRPGGDGLRFFWGKKQEQRSDEPAEEVRGGHDSSSGRGTRDKHQEGDRKRRMGQLDTERKRQQDGWQDRSGKRR